MNDVLNARLDNLAQRLRSVEDEQVKNYDRFQLIAEQVKEVVAIQKEMVTRMANDDKSQT